MRSRIAVLASGGGSNLTAILAFGDALPRVPTGEIAVVISSNAAAGALDRARERGVPTVVIADPSDARALDAVLQQREIDLVVLAGYLKLVPSPVVRRFRGRMLNVHPALLPAFGGAGMYGSRVHSAVIARGVRVSGPTVHFVDDEYDHGPIVAQWPVPVLPDDTPESLGARVLQAEHMIYPPVVEAVAARRISLTADGNVVHASPVPRMGAAFALMDAAAPYPNCIDLFRSF